MVNTFDSVQSQKVMIFLDVADTGILKQDSLVEENIAIAATLTRKLLRQSIETGFAFNSAENGEWILPTNKKGVLIGLERTLADYDATKGTTSFPEFFTEKKEMQEKLTDDTLLIVITKHLDETLWNILIEKAKDYTVLVIQTVYRGERQSAETRESLPNGMRVLVREVERV